MYHFYFQHGKNLNLCILLSLSMCIEKYKQPRFSITMAAKSAEMTLKIGGGERNKNRLEVKKNNLKC